MPNFAVGNSFLKTIYPYHPKFVGGAINDPIAREKFVSYTKMPVKGMMQIVALQNEVKSKMEKIVTPTLIIHSPNDTVAPFSSMDYMEKHLGSKIIRKVLAQKSNHVITLDYDYPLVVSEVVSFFKE